MILVAVSCFFFFFFFVNFLLFIYFYTTKRLTLWLESCCHQGSSRSNILGEANINLADYSDALKPSTVALPLHGCNSGTILHVRLSEFYICLLFSGLPS